MIKPLQPTYIMKLPSNDKEISYRPYVVKEEKALLLAMQDGNTKSIIENIKKLVYTCTFEVLDPSNTSYYDLEYAFLMIRSKSVGEIVDLIGGCECGAKTDFSIDIETATLSDTSQKAKFKIPESEYYIEMIHPTIDAFITSGETEEEKTDEEYYKTVATSIKSIYTQDEVYDSMSLDEKVQFLDDLTPKQQKPIAKYISNMPKLTVKGKYDCVGCGKHHDVDVAGIERFFI